MEPLTYRHHHVQRLRRLLGRRSVRRSERAFVAEGATVVGEALAAGRTVESVFYDPAGGGVPGDVLARAHDAGARLYELAPGVLERLGGTVTPQPIMAVVPALDVTLDHLAADLVVVCVDVRDPGNLGTVLRSAEAAGAGGVVACGESVDLYNPKVVRASAGALFHVPVVDGGDPLDVLARLGGRGLQRLGTSSGAALDHTRADWRRPTAVVLGNEAHGLRPGLEAELDDVVSIAMVGRAESLNVGMAAAVLVFEALRQRRLG